MIPKRLLFHPKRILFVAFGLLVFMLFFYQQEKQQSYAGDEWGSANNDMLVEIQLKLHEIAGVEVETSVPVINKSSSCDIYNHAAAMTRHAIHDVTNNRLYFNTDGDSVTMVTQMSSDRLEKLHLIMEHWTGPISVSVYVKEANLKNFISRLQLRSNVLVHVVTANGPYYPVNYLRNVALEATLTKFVFLSDIDFIPPPKSFEKILEYILTLKKNTVMVVPAFEEIRNKSRLCDHFPKNKNSLLELWKKDTVQPFHLHIFEPGQAPTDSHKWANITYPYKIQWSRWYEPYIIGYKDEMPRYNEQLVGRYENKALHIAELRARGLEFTVNPEVFLLHLWHPVIQFNRTIYNCSTSVSWAYTKYLERKYGVILM